ncbi:hypothetical protein AGMMS49525_09000 [Bacteroidia bacterium]|nr:hypothetical protein AGMMS49525_09000 [Bacteroidia bacterium]
MVAGIAPALVALVLFTCTSTVIFLPVVYVGDEMVVSPPTVVEGVLVTEILPAVLSAVAAFPVVLASILCSVIT